jgi:hypothetical protein
MNTNKIKKSVLLFTILFSFLFLFQINNINAEIKDLNSSPYIGYHLFNTDSGLANNPEFGIQGSYDLSDNFSIGGRLGLLYTLTRVKSSSAELFVLSFEANAKYSLKDIFPNDTFNPYIKTGLMDTKRSALTFFIGAGVNFNTQNVDLVMGKDSLLSYSPFEFNKKASDIKPKTKRKVIKKVGTIKANLEAQKVLAHLEYNSKFDFVDLKKHWAKNSVEWASKLHIINTDSKWFKPKAFISSKTASEWISATTIAYALKQKKTLAIKYSLQGNLKNYNVQLNITDSKNAIFNQIVSSANHKTGEFNYIWDGFANKRNLIKTKKKTMAKPGTYRLNYQVKAKDVKFKKDLMVKVLYLQDPINTFKFDIDSYPVKLNNVLLPKDIIAKATDKAITRVDYIVLIGKAIRKHRNIKPDITILQSYKDKDSIPRYAMYDVSVVIKELGFLGDYHKKYLNPNKTISRAEAIVILKRFYNWLDK